MKRWTILTTLPLALGACVSSIAGPERADTLRGHYSQGFEVDSFRECGSEESWWVTDAEPLRSRYRDLATAQHQSVYVELRGEAGPRGRYGHLGGYTRELSVDQVLVIRAASDDDCG
jgi:hypothetical protein